MATALPNPDVTLNADLLAPPPIINGEDPKEYFELWERFHAEAKPRDLTETALLRDVVDHIWEIRRLRRLKAGLLNAGACQGLELVLRPLCFESDEIAIKWRQRDAASVKQADEFLAQAGLGMAEVMAMTLGLNLSTVDAIDRIIERSEKRYHAALREIEHHREALAEPVRAIKGAEDAEFADVMAATPNRAAS